MNAAAKILDRAIGLLKLGVPPFEAIEVACARSYAGPVARERARRTFLNLLARAEREAA